MTTKPPVLLTRDEGDLLTQWVSRLSSVLIAPEYTCEGLRRSQASGGGWGKNYRCEATRFVGTWQRYTVVDGHTGQPVPDYRREHRGDRKRRRTIRLIFEPIHREASITYNRLQRWAANLPADLVDAASRAYSAGPHESREADLASSFTAAVALSVDHDPAGCTGQLAMFEVNR